MKSLVILLAFLAFLLIYLFSQGQNSFSQFKLSDFRVGSPAPKDVIMDRDITYTDEEATRVKTEAEGQLTAPVFRLESQISRRVFEKYDTLIRHFPSVYREDVSARNLFLRFQTFLPGMFTQEDWESLLEHPESLQDIIRAGEGLLNGFMKNGIFDLAAEGEDWEVTGIDVLYRQNGGDEFQHLDVQDIVTLENYSQAIDRMAAEGAFPREWAASLSLLMGVFLEENTFFDSYETSRRRKITRDSVKPVTRLLVSGEPIVRKGDIVTQDDYLKLKTVGNYALTMGNSALLGALVFLVFLFILAQTFYSYPLNRKPLELSQLLLIVILFLVFYLAEMLIIRLAPAELLSLFPVSALLPVSVIGMLVSLLMSAKIGVFTSMVFSLGHLLQSRMDPYSFLFVFFSCILGTIAVRDPDKKSYLVKATAIMAVSNGFLLLVIGLLKGMAFFQLFMYFSLGFVNGLVSGILIMGLLLPLAELLLNPASPSRLMEISDLNNPIFKRMLVLAPGTYSHTIAVANLAESAAREVNANGLLTRAGALYHDIGKIDQPEYFVENQTAGNKHDELKATLSAAVIKSHVKLGVEKAKELGLPQKVIDIVAQHHGSGLISYFYIQALKEQETGGQGSKVSPEDFSYHGIPPQNREAAIVMLADSVEAATRTLSKPTVAKLEKFIWEIIMGKIAAEQMRGCNLTFKDMEVIKRTFVQILAGQFHSRIEYPDLKKTVNELKNGKKE